MLTDAYIKYFNLNKIDQKTVHSFNTFKIYFEINIFIVSNKEITLKTLKK